IYACVAKTASASPDGQLAGLSHGDMRFVKHRDIIVNEEYLPLLKSEGMDSFASLFGYGGGASVKKKKTRSVVRVILGDKTFYLKRHHYSLKERLRNLCPCVLPEDAKNEWEKMILLSESGFLTMKPVAYGEEKTLGTISASFTLTEEVSSAVRAGDYIGSLADKGIEGVKKKREIIKSIALIAKDFHLQGFNHQDFYLGHFFVISSTSEIFIMDVQRVQKRNRPIKSRVIKDLGQFVFSAKNTANFSVTDLVRFGHAYLGKLKFDKDDRSMVKKVFLKAERIMRHDAKLLARAGKDHS
ncbi:MAG: lipopolysaccharide kinase InaA family protein, partial [Thermodesulfobacteriota bacterium]